MSLLSEAHATVGADASNPMSGGINLVKVFSVSKARERESIGDRITEWIGARRDLRIVKTIVALTSDLEFHCLSIVLLCIE